MGERKIRWDEDKEKDGDDEDDDDKEDDDDDDDEWWDLELIELKGFTITGSWRLTTGDNIKVKKELELSNFPFKWIFLRNRCISSKTIVNEKGWWYSYDWGCMDEAKGFKDEFE